MASHELPGRGRWPLERDGEFATTARAGDSGGSLGIPGASGWPLERDGGFAGGALAGGFGGRSEPPI